MARGREKEALLARGGWQPGREQAAGGLLMLTGTGFGALRKCSNCLHPICVGFGLEVDPIMLPLYCMSHCKEFCLNCHYSCLLLFQLRNGAV